MEMGAINPGLEGGRGRLPSPLVAPVWGRGLNSFASQLNLSAFMG